MKKSFLIALGLLLIFSCKHELERPSWDTDIIIPIARTNLNITNLISDTTNLINEDPNGFISLVFEQEFVNMNLDTLIKIDAIADEQTHTLDSTIFDDVVITDTASLGEVVVEAELDSLIPDGSTVIFIPAFPNIISEKTVNIDASEYFETMTLYKGMLIINIMNGYPTDISNVSLTLANSSNQNIIATFNFPIIPKGTTITDSVSIAGQTLDEDLIAILHNVDINQNIGTEVIDYSDAIITTITISDIGITEATAIFPEQQLTETLKEHAFNLGSAQIKEIGIKSGTVTINVLSTLPNGKMTYNIPSLSKNGISFTSENMFVPEATSNNLTSFDFDFQGYVLDLTGEEGRLGGDTINTIYTEAYTYIDSTGTLETINYTDSFYSFIEFDLNPEYAKGYLGQDTLVLGPEIIETDIFNIIESGNINLESATISIGINNFIGADAGVQINHLSAINGSTEIIAILDNTEIHNIERASITSNNTIIPTYTEIEIEADEMLEIFPNRLKTEATFYINPNGQSIIEDFLYPQYPIEANMNLKIPLSIIANKLSFIDTTDIDLPNNNENKIEKIYLSINNGFPFDAEIQLILIDENNLIIDTLLNNTIINAAQINDDNIVTNSTPTSIEINYNNFESVKRVVATSNFTTKPINEFIDIYSNYALEVAISAKINKLIEE